jgi:flagellar hook-associated protein 2
MAGIRIGGLASGMEIDKTIADMMRAHRVPVDRKIQKRTVTEWQRDQYREMNKLLKQLDDSTFDIIGKSSSFNTKKATSSNEMLVSASANPDAENGVRSIEVKQLAVAEKWNATSAPTEQMDKLLKDISGFDATNKLAFTVTKPGGSTSNVEIDFDPTKDTLASLMNKINSSGLGVKATMKNGVYEVTNRSTGAGTDITLANDNAANLFNKIGFANATTNGALSGKQNIGKNAEFTLDGVAMTKTSNVFTEDEVTYTLKGLTHGNAVTVGMETDVDKAVENIKKWMVLYNDTIDKINGELKEKRYRDYQPLTDEQKKEMTDSQVEKWEEKAKSGLLRSDSILTSGLSKMRQQITGVAENKNKMYTNLSQIGIATSSNYLDGGKLVLDAKGEEKLRKALMENPEEVHKLFNGDGSQLGITKTKDPKDPTKTIDTPRFDQGIVGSIRATIKQTMVTIEGKAGNDFRGENQFELGRKINSINKEVQRMERRLQDLEQRYWKQFSAMEKAINKSNQQGGYMMQQFS